MIKTRDLYLCALRRVDRIEYRGIVKIPYYNNEVKYVLAHKDEKATIFNLYEVYIDALTKTKYSMKDDGFVQSGNWYVRTTEPVITNRKFISEAEATEILTKLNPTFFEVKKEKVKKIK